MFAPRIEASPTHPLGAAQRIHQHMESNPPSGPKAGVAAAADGELEHLLAGCAAHDSAALRRLYDLTAPKLLGCTLRILGRRALAEEALQDVFVAIWQRASQYDSRRGSPWAWLICIARYRALDIARRERTELFRDAAVLDELPQLEDTEEPGGAASRWTAKALRHCLELLSVQQRRGIELAFIHGCSHAHIANVIGEPLGTVKSWIRRGLKSLRECLGP
jgi:RNA polymerase sigma-70 factor (ECF subfamily)